MTRETPDEEREAGDDQDAADDVSLLCLDLLLELEADEGDDSAQNDGGEHMSKGGKAADLGHANERPPFGAADHREGHPVIRQHGMHDADHGGAHHQQLKSSCVQFAVGGRGGI